MKKSYRITLFILLILILIIGGSCGYYYFFYKKEEQPPTINEVKITNNIENYGYTLEDRDTELFKEKFEELQQLLKEEYEKEEYLKLVSQLFIIDLYTINNKISRYDIGGLEYVYNAALPSFKSVVESSIYKTVENNIDGKRTQNLPEVASIEVNETSEMTYQMPDESEVSGYRVKMTWAYKEDLGYDTEGVLILIPDNNKLAVVFYKPVN